jgi:hypothetical protein
MVQPQLPVCVCVVDAIAADIAADGLPEAGAA